MFLKLIHTADWHLGKLVQGVYMTEDQRYILDQLIEAIKEEKPDAVIIAGDLYDRAIPPTEAVDLLNDVLQKIVLELKTPVLAISGNHDSPDRIHFGNQLMKAQGLHIVGQLQAQIEPVILYDKHGEVHFYLVPYTDPGKVKYVYQDDQVRTHDDATKAIVQGIEENMKKDARHVFIGHAFVTQRGEKQENTSDSERPLSIGGAEHVNSNYFSSFHYTALGHLHQAHHVGDEKIRYSGSLLKYSISEERHKKGYYIVDINQDGEVEVDKRFLQPKRDMRIVEGYLQDIEKHERNDDYVFVRLLDENPILFPMEKVRSVYPNCMHVERVITRINQGKLEVGEGKRQKMDDLSLFKSFYKEVKGTELTEDKESLFKEVLEDILKMAGERV